VSFTVVPLHNLELPAGTVIPFGKFTIQDIPEWLLKDRILKELSKHDRDGLRRAKHALVSEYAADSWGYPDPEWTGTEQKGIQNLRWQAALLANMCMWMVIPSPVCVTCGFPALTTMEGRQYDPPITNYFDHETTLYCDSRDLGNRPTTRGLRTAAQLFETLSTVPRKNAVWQALRAFWAATTSYQADLRYPLYWQGLESLFGSETDPYRVSKRLRNRISYFLADNARVQQELHDKIEASYAKRCDIVHGRWEDSQEFRDVHMYTTECIVRTVVRQIADRPGMLGAFLSPKRNEFLEAWVQSKAFTPPSNYGRS
jgi:hypothetical protein